MPLQNALLFVGYGYGERVGGTGEAGSLTPVFVGGCLGGFVQSFVVSPAELLKVRMQLAPTTSGTLDLAAVTYRSIGGTQTLTRGLTATLYRDVLPHGVWFAR